MMDRLLRVERLPAAEVSAKMIARWPDVTPQRVRSVAFVTAWLGIYPPTVRGRPRGTLTSPHREAVLALHKQGYSLRQIASLIVGKTGESISYEHVRRIVALDGDGTREKQQKRK